MSIPLSSAVSSIYTCCSFNRKWPLGGLIAVQFAIMDSGVDYCTADCNSRGDCSVSYSLP